MAIGLERVHFIKVHRREEAELCGLDKEQEAFYKKLM